MLNYWVSFKTTFRVRVRVFKAVLILCFQIGSVLRVILSLLVPSTGPWYSWQQEVGLKVWSILHRIWSHWVSPKLRIWAVKVCYKKKVTRLAGSEFSSLLLFLNADCLAVWGFRGVSPSPPWVSLQTGQGDEVLGLLERYLPMSLETYGCAPPAAQSRKDLELLKKATAPDWLMWTPRTPFEHWSTNTQPAYECELLNF